MAATDLINVEIVLSTTVAADGGSATQTNNVFTFSRPSAVLPYTYGNIMDAFETAIATPLADALHEDSTGWKIKARNLNDATSAYVEQSSALVGLITGERAPSFVSVCIHLKSGYRGRQYNGRKHFSPLGESQISGDVLVAGSITLFQAVRDAIAAGFVDSDGNVWSSCVVARTASTLDTNPTDVQFVNVTSCTLNTEVGTMTRRHA